MVTIDDFKRILRIFFGEVLNEAQGDIEFILRLTEQNVETKIMYREFCKFLSKRFVRTFKHVVKQGNAAGNEDSEFDDFEIQKSALEQDLDRPLTKEATLNYIMRKGADLQIDLRKEFVSNDSLELHVIPRVKFWGILIGLPLGLSEEELAEVFDNDLDFDNCGNVDYTAILNSDIFVALERKRLTSKALKMANKLRTSQHQADLRAA